MLIVERSVGLAAAVITSPIWVVAAILIKLTSRGPVFYRARRVGRNGVLFDALKFRTMASGATDGPRVTADDDDRITSVGRWLRRTKIDELPQLINVVKGEMALVGPRPEDPQYVAMYTPEQRKILRYRPGITSPASLIFRDEQSALRGVADLEAAYRRISAEKLKIDFQYFSARTWLSDSVVLALTLIALVGRVEASSACRLIGRFTRRQP